MRFPSELYLMGPLAEYIASMPHINLTWLLCNHSREMPFTDYNVGVQKISLILMSIFYLFSGVNHFRSPRFYLRIIPPMLPFPEVINMVSGVAEIVLAIMLVFPATSRVAAWGVIALLIAIFPANIYHYISGGAGMNISQTTLAIRLPLQFLLMGWAYWHTC